MAGKNQDIIELIIEGKDEYSDISADVRQELSQLTDAAKASREEFDKLENALDLADTYRKQETEVDRLSAAQAKSRIEVDTLTKTNRKAKGANLEVAASLAKARAELSSVRTATNRAQKQFDTTKDSMRQYGQTIDSVEKSQKEMRASADKLGNELTELSKSQTEVVKKARSHAEATKGQVKAYDESRQAVEKNVAAYEKQYAAFAESQRAQQKTTRDIETLTVEVKEQAAALEKGDITWEDYKRRVNDAGRVSDLTRKQIAQVSRAMDAQAIAARKTGQSLLQQRHEAKRVAQATKDYRDELERLVEEYKQGGISAAKFEKAEAQLRKKMRLSERQVNATRKALGAYSDKLDVVAPKQLKQARSTDKLTKVTRRLAQAYTVLLAAQKAIQVGADSGKAYADSEEAMLGLQKTTTLTASEIQGLAEEMTRLSTDVTPTTAVKLLEVAEAAGRMGVEGAENIRAFTVSIDALSSATGLAGSETAQAIAQILNVTGEAQSNVTGVSAAIAELGNTSATTEEQIVHFGKRLASDTATAKLTSAEVLGLGAAMAEMGVQAEGSSTVVGRTFRFIEDAVKSGGESMEELQRVTGMSGEEIEKAFGEDKVGLFTQFIKGMGRMQDGGKTLNQILSDMGIKSDENARILGLLTQRHEGLTSAVERSNEAFKKGDAHFEEMAKKAASLTGSFERLQNRSTQLSKAVGEAFSDELVNSMDASRESGEALEEKFADMGEAMAEVIEKVVDIGKTVGGLLDTLDALSGGIVNVSNLFSMASAVMDSMIAVINLAIGGFAELAIIVNDFFGNTEAVEKWEKVQTEAFERTGQAAKDFNDRIQNVTGEASRAYQDLRDAYAGNTDALGRMDEAQREAVANIINSVGYIEGNDKAYRDLTRAIQRAATEKQILAGLSDEENIALQGTIDLLVAQGKTLEEATQAAKQRAQAQMEQAQAEREVATEKKQADQDELVRKEALKQQQEGVTAKSEEAKKAIKEQSKAWKALGLDIGEATDSVTEHGQKIVESLNILVSEGDYTAEQLGKAFDSSLDSVDTVKDIEAIIDTLKKARESGDLVGRSFSSAMSKAKVKLQEAKTKAAELAGEIKGIGTDARKSAKKMDDLNRSLKDSGKSGSGSIGDLTKAMEQLVAVVEKLTAQYGSAADEAARMVEAGGGSSGGGKSGYRSMAGQVSDRLRSQDKGDVADVLERMVANKEVNTSAFNGLKGQKEFWDSAIDKATGEVETTREKYRDLARLQRGVAAGDTDAARRLLDSREQFSELSTDLLSAVTAASAVLKGSQVGVSQQTTGPQQVKNALRPVVFNFGGQKVSGEFEPEQAEALIRLLQDHMSVTG